MSANRRLGLGCAQLGNLYVELDDRAATAIVDRAWSVGVRLFDTAPHYGLGLSESRLGAALRGRPRHEYLVSTKVGRRLERGIGPLVADPGGFKVTSDRTRVVDFSAGGVRETLYSSLERLGVDHVDIALLHDPQMDPENAIGPGLTALHRLRDEGVVRRVGVGTSDVGLMRRFVVEQDLDTVLVAGRLTLLNQEAGGELMEACATRGVEVLNAGVFNSGVLAASEPDAHAMYEYKPAGEDILKRARRLRNICRGFGIPLAAAALQYGFREAPVSAVVVGAESPVQIEETARLAEVEIPGGFWEALIAESLIPPSPLNDQTRRRK